MRPLLRALARQPDPLSDAALLARYAADRDPAAFEVLVWRHGGLVLGVCRRRLRDTHAAEDAFQAVFLILARQAGRVRGETLPGFLHRVARRVAGRAARKHNRRRETALVADPPARPPADPELAAVLDAEIDRLPERLRQVVVLCYLDGQSTEWAASRLGIPRGTVLSRLHTARAKLGDRLRRRGVTAPAVGLTAVLTAEQVSGGVRAAGGGVAVATILANEVLVMGVRKLVVGVACGLVLAGGAGTGVGVLSAQSGSGPPSAKTTVAPPARANPAVAAIFAELDARIEENQRIDTALSAIVLRIEQAKGAVRYYESELTRLNARRSALEQGSSRLSKDAADKLRATPTDLATALALHPEYASANRALLTLRQQRHLAIASRKSDEKLQQEIVAAENQLVALRSRLTMEIDRAANDRFVAEMSSYDRDATDAIAVTQREVDNFKRDRRASDEEILKLTNELRVITPRSPEDVKDELRRLRARKDAVETEVQLQTIRGGASSDKLDAILAELRDLRRLVEAKKSLAP